MVKYENKFSNCFDTVCPLHEYEMGINGYLCCMQQTVSAHRVLCSVMTLLGYLCVGCTCLPA